MRRRLPAIPGRFWWAEALGAMATGALAVAGPAVFLSNMLPLEAELGTGDGATLALAAGLALMLLVLMAILVYHAARDRYRWRVRGAALLGDLAAIPQARDLPTPSEPPDVSQQPLELLWRASRSQRLLATPLSLLLVLLELGSLAVSVIVAVIAFTDLASSLPFALRAALLPGIALVIAAVIFIVVLLLRLMPTYLLGRPYGAVASDAGLECRTEFGRRFTITWSDAKLFEVEKTSGLGRMYYLYGARQVAKWRSSPANPSEFAPAGISSPEMALRVNALDALIVTRTGLSPRTFTRSLTRDDQSRPVTTSRVRTFIGYTFVAAFMMALALACFAMAAAVLLLPLTPLGPLNAVFAIGPAATGLLLLTALAWLLVRWIANRRRLGTTPYQPQPVVAPPLATQDTVFSLQYRLSAAQRAAFAAYGILALPSLIPAALLILPTFIAALRLTAPDFNPASDFVAYLLAMFSACGFFGLAVARRGTLASALYVNKQGIGTGSNRIAMAIPWPSVEQITARRNGQWVRYVIRGADTFVSWTDNPHRRHLLHALPGTSAITPGELAALASERSGKPIEWM